MHKPSLILLFLFWVFPSVHASSNEDMPDDLIKPARLHNEKFVKDHYSSYQTLISQLEETLLKFTQSSSSNAQWNATVGKPICVTLREPKNLLIDLKFIVTAIEQQNYNNDLQQAGALFSEVTSQIEDSKKRNLEDIKSTGIGKDAAFAAAKSQTTLRFLFNDLPRRRDISTHVKLYVSEKLKSWHCEQQYFDILTLKQFIQTHGWPIRSRFERKVEYFTFLVVQHANFDPHFMNAILAIFDKLKFTGEINDKFYPDLYDKIAIYQRKPQRFGTFVTCVNGKFGFPTGLENNETINELRANFKLPSIEEKMMTYPETC